MGVEPTAASFALPATDFEDQGAHRDTCQPASIMTYLCQMSVPYAKSGANRPGHQIGQEGARRATEPHVGQM